MSEIGLMFFGVFKIITVLTGAILYSLGGRDGISKGVRRFGASAIIVGGTCYFAFSSGAFNWWYLLSYPLLCTAYSLGYGSDNTLGKVIKRAYCGLAIVVATSPIALLTGRIEVLIVQAVVALTTSIILGIKSKIPASQEELLIGFMTSLCVPFYV
tara:strand:+ start:3809 stop:4276 length:468 start_codon:yes stop_codon:yes gene_type:complete